MEESSPCRSSTRGNFVSPRCGWSYAGEKQYRPLPHRRRTQPGHGIGNLLLGRQPPEELPQRPVLLACVRLAVAAQQPGDPPLNILGAHLAPPGLARLAKQVGGGEPQRRLGVDPDRPGPLVLRRQVQPERGDIRTERPRLQPPQTTPAPIQVCGSFTLVPRFRAPEAAGIAASWRGGTVAVIWRTQTPSYVVVGCPRCGPACISRRVPGPDRCDPFGIRLRPYGRESPDELAFILAGAAVRQVEGLVGNCCRKEDIAATPLSAKPLIAEAGSRRRSPPQGPVIGVPSDYGRRWCWSRRQCRWSRRARRAGLPGLS